MALDFLDGYTIQLHPQIKVAKRFDQFNPFISLIEKNRNPKSAWFVNKHSHWKRETRIQQVRGVRTWASIIHNENKKNRFYGFGDAEVESCLEDFGMNDQQKDIIATNLVPVSEWKYQSLSNLLKSYWNYSFKNMKKYLGIYKFR